MRNTVLVDVVERRTQLSEGLVNLAVSEDAGGLHGARFYAVETHGMLYLLVLRSTFG